MGSDQRPLLTRIDRYFAAIEAQEMVTCGSCDGSGEYRGPLKTWVDPEPCDWCGGSGKVLHPDADAEPDDLLKEARERLETCEKALKEIHRYADGPHSWDREGLSELRHCTREVAAEALSRLSETQEGEK